MKSPYRDFGKMAGEAAGAAVTASGNFARDVGKAVTDTAVGTYKAGEQVVGGAVKGFHEGVKKVQRVDTAKRLKKAVSGAIAYPKQQWPEVMNPLEKAFIKKRSQSPAVDMAMDTMKKLSTAAKVQKAVKYVNPWSTKRSK